MFVFDCEDCGATVFDASRDLIDPDPVPTRCFTCLWIAEIEREQGPVEAGKIRDFLEMFDNDDPP